MQFFKPESFIYLWSIPLVLVIFMMSGAMWKKRMALFADSDTLKTKLVPHLRTHFLRVRFLMLSMVFIFAVLALARPQWGEAKKKVERKGVDIIFMLDTSLSMLAEDNKPNRLEKAKLEIKNFVHSLQGDRIGMVAFAGSSFLQAPLTLDYSAFFLFLDAVDVGYIPDPGTSLLNAIRRGITAFPEKETKHKAIILFTDGEDHAGGELKSIVDMAKEYNVRIYTVGLGSEEGEPIPLKDEYGRRTGYKKDRMGQVVITAIDKKNLEILANETGGLFFPSSASEQEVRIILKHLDSLGKRQFKERIVTERDDHFQLFLTIAFLFLMAEMFVQRHSKKKLNEVLGILLCFFMFSGFISTTSGLNEKANELYEEKQYDSALENYRKAQVKSPDNPSVLYNLATTLYQKQEYQEAKKHLETVIETTDNDSLKAQAHYNYGNTLYRLGEFDAAIKSYESALELMPDDEDSKFNLEFLQKTKNKFEKENQDKQQENQEKDKKDQQQQKNEQNQQQQDQQKQDQDQQNKNQQNQEQDQKDQQNQEQDKDQESQGSGDKDEDQKDSSDKDQDKDEEKDSKPDEEKQGDQEKEKKDEQEKDQKKDASGDEGDQEKEEPENKEGEEEQPASPEPEQGDQQQEQQPQQPQPEQGPQEMPQQQEQGQQQQAPSPGSQGQVPLQGQMTMDNALRILDALKDGEKDLQDLRRPPASKNPVMVAKDW